MSLTLRPYQQRCLAEIRTKFRAGTHRQLVKMATGLGKTPLLASLPDALGFKGKLLVLVHREELAQQAADQLARWNPRRSVGVEMAERRAKPTDQLIVASVQTLGRRGSSRLARFRPEEFDAIVVDECHHATASSYRAILDHFGLYEDPHRLFLGVTATPNRADGEGLGDIFQELVFDMGVLDGIREGWLADLRGYRLMTDVALDSVRSRSGDFALEDLEKTVNTSARNHLVARAWLEYGERRPTIAYAVDIQHAQDLAEAFRSYGVNADAIWGDDPDRADKLARHREGEIEVLVNCQVLTEGYDDWRVGCLILARPTQSELLYTQIVGRGTRIPSDIGNLVQARQQGQQIAKEDCLLIDVVDLTRRHELITLPALFGLNHAVNLGGRTITEVLEEFVQPLEESKKYVDLKRFADLVELERYMIRLDLFRSDQPAEMVRISPNRWRREGKSTYTLRLKENESLAVMNGFFGEWGVLGTIAGQRVRESRPTLEEAVRAADDLLDRIGGGRYASLVRRGAPWRSEAPTVAQLQAAQRMRIKVPPTATRGDLYDRLADVMAKRAIA